MLVLPSPVQSKLSSTPAKLVALDLSLPVSPKPDYEAEVLTPLHAIQAAKKAEDGRVAQLARQAAQSVPVASVRVSGTCQDWMTAAGINDFANASYVINRESGCNPFAVNRSSGACGIGQALPCSKMNCAMGDGLCQMIWTNSYVLSRYGSWANAANHSRMYNWY